MFISGFWFLLAVASIMILAAAIRGSQTSLYFLVPAGAIFIIMGSLVFSSGIQIRNGTDITIYNETTGSNDIIRIENETAEYKNIFDIDENMNNWFGAILVFIGALLSIVGSAWGYLNE